MIDGEHTSGRGGAEDKGRPTPNSDAIVTALLERLMQDRAAGITRPDGYYRALFPGHEAIVDAELDTLNDDAPTTSVTAEVPDRIGPYRILRSLGRGGFGMVFLAQDTRLDRPVALKIMTGLGPLSVDRLQRFRREAEIASRLDHPGICTVYEAGEVAGQPYIAMRYVAGKTLAQLIESRREQAATNSNLEHPPFADDVRLVLAAARALEVAHHAGIVHRDVKPANIMVSTPGDPVLLDFGLAREAGDATLTQPWENWGTLSYMAPERLSSPGDPSPSVDVYSLGVVLFECIALERPFEAPTAAALSKAIVEDEPSRAPLLRRRAPRDLMAVVMTAIEKDPSRRYRTAKDMADDLERYLEGRPVEARPISGLTRLARWSRRKPAVAALLAVLILGLPTMTALSTYLWLKLPDIRTGEAVIETAERERLLARAYFALSYIPSERSRRDLGRSKREEALRIFERILASSPEAEEALAGKTLALVGLDRVEDAKRFVSTMRAGRHSGGLERMLANYIDHHEGSTIVVAPDEFPNEPFALYLTALLAIQDSRGDVDVDLVRAWRMASAAALRSEVPRQIFHFQRAQAAAMTGDPFACREAAETILHFWPDEPLALFYAGFAWHGCGDFARAIDAFAAAYKRDETFYFARLSLAAALQDQGDLTAAVPIYQELLIADPKDPTVNFNLARLWAKRGSNQMAATFYATGLEGDPDYPQALYDLATIKIGLDRSDEARRLLERLVKLQPENVEAHVHLGVACGNLGDLAAAADAFRRALDLDPTQQQAQLNLVISLAMDDEVEAMKKEISARYSGTKGAEAALGNARVIFADRASGRAMLLAADALAERASQLYENRNPRALFLLAKTRAELGDRDDGIDLAETALDIEEAKEKPDQRFVAEVKKWLER